MWCWTLRHWFLSQLNQGFLRKKKTSKNIIQYFETNLCAKCRYIYPDFFMKKQTNKRTYIICRPRGEILGFGGLWRLLITSLGFLRKKLKKEISFMLIFLFQNLWNISTQFSYLYYSDHGVINQCFNMGKFSKHNRNML